MMRAEDEKKKKQTPMSVKSTIKSAFAVKQQHQSPPPKSTRFHVGLKRDQRCKEKGRKQQQQQKTYLSVRPLSLRDLSLDDLAVVGLVALEVVASDVSPWRRAELAEIALDVTVWGVPLPCGLRGVRGVRGVRGLVVVEVPVRSSSLNVRSSFIVT
jgi:hypothetical protein